LKIFLKLNTFVEIKKIRIRKSSYIVPFSINFKRRVYLITKWLLSSSKENNSSISFAEKLSLEIISIVKNSSSNSLKKKNTNISLAFANRSNIHFRW